MKTIALSLVAALTLAACHHETRNETAGEKLDAAGDKVERAADRAGDKIERGVEKTGEAAERAGDKIREDTRR